MVKTTKMKKSSLSKAQKKQVRKIASDVLDDEIEDKGYVFTRENIQLVHNIPQYVQKFLSDPVVGVNDGDQSLGGGTGVNTVRVGDRITLKNINIRFMLNNKLDRPNVTYKGMLFWYPTNTSASNEMVWKTQTNKLLDRYNTKEIQILDQFIIKSSNNYASNPDQQREKTYLATLNKSWKNKKIQYSLGNTFPKMKDIGFSIVAYDAFGTLQTDVISSYAYQSVITFQDA